MLTRNRNIFIMLVLAVIAICIGIKISLANFNQDIDYDQPIEAFECYQTAEGWYVSFLNINANLQKDQLVQVVQPVTTAVNNFPIEEVQQYQQVALTNIANWWQQVVNSNPLETVRCLTEDIIDKVDSK